jgi:PAS domain S-box-containing protein
MNGSDAPSDPAGFTPLHPEQALRDKSIEKLRTLEDLELSTQSPEEILRTLHELRVHQIELKMQNEELRQTQVNLNAERARYFDLYNLAPIGYVTLGEKGLIKEANLTAATLLGLPRGELTNKPISMVLFKEDQSIYSLHSKQLFESGTQQVFKLRMIKKDETVFWAQLNATVAHDSAGTPVFLVAFDDITERQQAEEVLQEEEQYLRTILQTTSDGFWEVDVRGNITKVNETYCRMSGYTGDELLKLTISAIDANETPASTAAHIKRLVTIGSEVFETRHRRKDGSIFHVEISATYINKGLGKFVCFCRDISERKQAEQNLLKSEKDFTRAQEVGNIGSWRLDIQKNRLTWSDQNHRIFGIPPGTPLNYETFLSCIHPDDRSIVDAAWKAGLCGAPYDIEHRIVVDHQIKWVREKAYLEFAEDGVLTGGFGITQDITERKEGQLKIQKQREDLQIILDSCPIMIFHKDCESRYIHVNKALAHVVGLPKEAMEGKSDFEIFPSQAQYYRESDQEVIVSDKPQHGIIQLMDTAVGPKWVQTDKIPYRDHNGHIVGIIGFSIDITERRQAEEELQSINNELERRVEERTRELQETQLQYLHAEKLSAIGKLSASIAHEFNNPLQSIMSVLKGLKKRAILEEEDKELLNAAIDESERIKKLIRTLQEFNRPSSCRKVVMDVHTSIDSLLLLHKSEFKNKRISVERHYAERLPQIMAIPDQIKQVLLNLLTNAADACQQVGGIITIRTWLEGERVAISIKDTGVGIQPEHLDVIFQPFYTTKAEVKGTGLGLSVCHGIVKNHQGEIRVESKPGQGSVFTLLLPAQSV